MRHSYSSISKYLECPAAYHYRYILKIEEPSTPAMDRGTRLHKLAEDYMNADFSVPVPYDLRRIGPTLYHLREKHAVPEKKWLLDTEWKPVKKEEDAHLKAVIDIHRVSDSILYVHDYKSGREYPSHANQLELYAAIGLCVYPSAKRAESSAIYIDSGHEGSKRSIIREMLPYIMGRWNGFIARVDSDNEFLPTGGDHCQRCAFSSKTGGTCQGWKGFIA